MTSFAPIVLFVYNRPMHTQKTVESLLENFGIKNTDLVIYSDGPKNKYDVKDVAKVRNYLKDIKGVKSLEIFESEGNKGLAKSIISGVDHMLDVYEKVIVLEDDILLSNTFIKNMNSMLDLYKNNQHVMSISGYNHPPNVLNIKKQYPYDIFFNIRCSSWGWATWKSRWKSVDWSVSDYAMLSETPTLINSFNRGGADLYHMLSMQIEGLIDSWAIRWQFEHFKKNAYAVWPVKSMVNNIGHDSTGVHCSKSTRLTQSLHNNVILKEIPKYVFVDSEIQNSFCSIYKSNSLRRLLGKTLRRIKK